MKRNQEFIPYHPVTFVPTNDPKYIDGQVHDILSDYQEEGRVPFSPGPIGMLKTNIPAPDVLNIPQTEYNEMLTRLWARHDRLPRAKKRRGYSVTEWDVRKQCRVPDHLSVVWNPETHSFNITLN